MSSSESIKLYVSPDGNDKWLGKLPNPNAENTDGPLASLAGARDAIRQMKKGDITASVSVIVADGVYSLSETLVFTEEDSGTEAYPVSYEAAEGASPVFSGGREISGFQEAEDGVWKTHISDVKAGKWYFEQLYINNRRAIRARTPNEFYFYMRDVKEAVIEQGPGSVPKKAKQTIDASPEDIESLLDLSEEELHDVNIQIYHKWDNTRRHLDKVDAEASTLITSGQGMKHWNNWHKNTRYHLENFKSALDAPGEWFLDRDGTLSYIPLPDEDMINASVVAPVIEKFLIFEGDLDSEQYVEHINLRGLTFRYAHWPMPPGGFEASQAASPIEAAVMADDARYITISECEIAHIGIYGVWFRRGCNNCRLESSYIYDFGAGGVRIGETAIREKLNERTGYITIDNNIINSGGYLFPCAIGVWIGHSGNNNVTHNDISDMYYTGISVGWRWGYGESLAKNNNISFNRAHHLGQGVLSDMGGIYTLGPSEGTRVCNNVFHDVYSYDYGGWGLYTDEGSTGIIMENNLCYNTKTGNFHQHYGKENIIRNNIFAFSLQWQIQHTRVEEHLSYTFERNIIYWDKGLLMRGPYDKAKISMDHNLYWHKEGESATLAGFDIGLQEWQKLGRDVNSIIANPLFVDPDKLDFCLKPNSPALQIGFKPFDPSKAGVYGSPEWIAKAKKLKFRPLVFAPSAPSD